MSQYPCHYVYAESDQHDMWRRKDLRPIQYVKYNICYADDKYPVVASVLHSIMQWINGSISTIEAFPMSTSTCLPVFSGSSASISFFILPIHRGFYHFESFP